MKKEFKDITTFEELLEASGLPAVPEFNEVPENMREHFQNHYKQIVAAYAANEGKKLDWRNPDQRKYLPWFVFSPSGFSFGGTDFYDSLANAGDASRLCYVNRDRAAHVARICPDIFENSLTK